MEKEPWLTALFNEHLAGVANSVLGMVNYKVEDPAHPWATWMVMELLVFVVILALFAVLKPKLSVDKPGALQHVFEGFYGFFKVTVDEAGIHHGERFIPYFGTIFIFILFMNLLGIIPTFESPTMSASVTLALALCTFIFYNAAGLKANGPGYLKQFLGPVLFLAPLMIIIEIISHLARPLSLTIRLYANMMAGDQVTGAFEKVVPLLVPVVFMGLHVFVAFLQAYIFMLLSVVYVSGAVSHEH